jgi:succinyl-CoA synthetase beta subunit
MALDVRAQVVVKSQILAGGRGLGRFTNGLQGGVHIVPASEAGQLAARMLGQTLVTKQTGPAGKPVNTLLVARKMKLAREMYLAFLQDRKVCMGSPECVTFPCVMPQNVTASACDDQHQYPLRASI